MFFITIRRFTVLLFFLTVVPAPAAVSADQGRQWVFREFIVREGTSLEGRMGVLTFRGRKVPEMIRLIACPSGLFYYRARKPLVHTWYGWLRDGDFPGFRTGAHITPVTPRDMIRKWYRGGLSERKRGTPDDWIWISFGSRSFWIKAEGLFHYARVLAASGENL